MKLITKFVAAAVLVGGINNVFADEGRKEAVLDMGKGAFTLTVSVPADLDGPYDFGKNPGIGKAMDGQFQYQEVMFSGDVVNTTATVVYKATSQKIDPNKKGQKLTAEHMAKDQIKANGFQGRAEKINCPPAPIEEATAVCYKMSGDAIFEGKATNDKSAAFLMSVSWKGDTQGYTLMGRSTERNIAKFNSDPSYTEKTASKALSYLWKFHKVNLN
jgi:hypothetical protein